MILLTGASSYVGLLLLDIFSKNNSGHKIRCLIRDNSKNLSTLKTLDVELFTCDLCNRDDLMRSMEGVDTIIHIAGIRFSRDIMDVAIKSGVKRAILIHTTGMYSKYRDYSDEYIQIEKRISQMTELEYVILRPTMIYGSKLDQNMHKLIEYISSHKLFPIFGSGNGKMQPVHGSDVANALYLVFNNPNIKNKAYNISGGSILSYKEILLMISKRVNTNIKFVFIPFFLSILLGRIYTYFARNSAKISIEQIRRLNEDKTFSFVDAQKDFGYLPMSFEKGIDLEITEVIKR